MVILCTSNLFQLYTSCGVGLMLCFFNDTATTEIYTYGHTLSLPDALPISNISEPMSPVRTAAPQAPASGCIDELPGLATGRSEEHTSELQSLMRSSYAVFCLKKKRVFSTIPWFITLNDIDRQLFRTPVNTPHYEHTLTLHSPYDSLH